MKSPTYRMDPPKRERCLLHASDIRYYRTLFSDSDARALRGSRRPVRIPVGHIRAQSVIRQSGRRPHVPFFGSMGEVRGSQLTGMEILEPTIEFSDAPSPRLAKKDHR